jgi:hypothetical protein
MKKLPISTLVVLGLALPPGAGAATLQYNTAARRADRAAAGQARRVHAVSWEISRGFRFAGRKMVFAWYGQLADGRGCGAQLVVRYASRNSRKVVAYFRNQECS